MGCRVQAVAAPHSLLLAGVRVSSVGKVREIRDLFTGNCFHTWQKETRVVHLRRSRPVLQRHHHGSPEQVAVVGIQSGTLLAHLDGHLVPIEPWTDLLSI